VAGEHVQRAAAGYDTWARLGRPERRIGVYVYVFGAGLWLELRRHDIANALSACLAPIR